jgi:primosomal protein N' (replication factor Y)
MRYAEVSVNSPAAQRRAFSYAVPAGMDVGEGQAVLVPFGEKVLQGVVLELSPRPAVEDTREIIDIIESRPVLSAHHLSLARWISGYYLSPLFDAVALMLPPGFERKAVTFIGAARSDIDPAPLDDDRRKLLELVSVQGRVEIKRLEKALGKKKASAIISAMVRQGLLSRSY